MTTGYLPTKDLELQQWLVNFVNIATGNETTLGIKTSDLDPITIGQLQFNDALSQIQTTRLDLDSAVKNKETVHKPLTKNIRAIVKKIQSNPTVPLALKSQLGINASSGARTKTAPVTPSTLVATPYASGVNNIAWSKIGNKPTTQYVVYAKPLTSPSSINADTGWTMVGQTTRSKFDHIGVTPGQPLAYKVVAARADQASLPSAPVTVYGA